MTIPVVQDIIPITPAAAEKKKSKGEMIGQGGMIQPFWGEFLQTPSPLEWSLNYCSHACAYCFANLNSPTRKGDASKALRQVAEIGRRATLTDLYLRNKYPVCIANKTDPFSESNYRETLPVILALKEAGVPIQFQTKGGKGIDEVLDGLPPSVWYITVAQWDDAVRKRVEPGAPSIGERLDLIAQLVEREHAVVVGINPCVPEWLPDNVGPMIETLSELGVWGAWMDRLHLNDKQVMFMPPPARKQIGESSIKRAIAKATDDSEQTILDMVREACDHYGMTHFQFGHPDPTDYFAVWRDVYDNTLPIVQDVANVCHEIHKTGDLIAFDEFVEILEESATPFFKGRQRIGDYMRVVSYRTVEKVKKWSDWMTYRQLLWFAWNNPGNKLSLATHPNFAIAQDFDSEGNGVILTDDNGLPYHVFVRRGVAGHYFPIGDADLLAEVDG